MGRKRACAEVCEEQQKESPQRRGEDLGIEGGEEGIIFFSFSPLCVSAPLRWFFSSPEHPAPFIFRLSTPNSALQG